MRNFILLILLPYFVFAECDFKTILKQKDKFVYSRDCHLKVGEIKLRLDNKEKETFNLRKIIDFKNLIIKDYKERSELWRRESEKLDEKLLVIKKEKERNKWYYFLMGSILTTINIYVSTKLRK